MIKSTIRIYNRSLHLPRNHTLSKFNLYNVYLYYIVVLDYIYIYINSGVSRISFRGGFKFFLEKWGYLHGAKRHAARGEATRLLGGFGGMLPRENF